MMMKLWSRLCFLVLVISSVSTGQDQTTVPPGDRKEVPPTVPAPPLLLDETQYEVAAGTIPSSMLSTMPSTMPPLRNTSANATDLPSIVFTTQEEETNNDLVNKTSEEVSISTAAQMTTLSVSTTLSGNDSGNVDMTAAASTSKPAPVEGARQSSWGYVLLVLILLVIVILCVILYFLRRVSRTYSFDLQRQFPSNHPDEPTGTFEPVYLDNLDRADQVTTSDLSPPPVSNGITLQSDERGSNGESAPQEQPDANGLMETSPTSNASNTSNTSNNSPSLGDDRADQTPSPLSNLFFDVMGEEQQNENNNNPSVCSSDPFVEINLDEPAWCGQLLTSPEAPSSVLPFSPFSFSSSSLSSSS